MIAPFLKEKFGWIDSDRCWWCGSGRQTREHLFKECSAWKEEIRELWREVGEATGGGRAVIRGGIVKGRKGFGLRMRGQNGKTVRGPGNTSIRALLADERCMPAVLSFLRDTKRSQLKEGMVLRITNT